MTTLQPVGINTFAPNKTMHLPNPRRSLTAYALALVGRFLPIRVLLALNRNR